MYFSDCHHNSMADAYDVKLYVYDVSQGLARSMSGALLGRQLDGVWHTGVVVYGQEWFFGGGGGGSGISNVDPGTLIGPPHEVVDMGQTEIPFDLYNEFLLELSHDTFHSSKYHLLDHNCNTFSNVVTQFLTGKSIPPHITNLPGEVLQTPLGQMLRPMIDQLMNTVSRNAHHIDEGNPPPANQSSQQQQSVPPQSTTTRQTEQKPRAESPELD